MKAIVLGASGQIGTVVFDTLKRRHDVTGTSRRSLPGLFQFDPFRDDWSVLGNADVLVNCVGQIDTRPGMDFKRIHQGLTELIIHNRPAMGSPRIIQISALGARADHPVEFLCTKGHADALLMKESNVAVLRPSIVCTHRTAIVRKFIVLGRIAGYTGGVIPVPQGFLQTRIQPVMPSDLAEVVEAVCTRIDSTLVNVPGPDATSFRDILMTLSEASGRRLHSVEVTRKIMDPLVAGVVARLWPTLVNQQQYQLLFEDNVADVAPAEHLLRRRLSPIGDFFQKEFTYAAD